MSELILLAADDKVTGAVPTPDNVSAPHCIVKSYNDDALSM